MDGSHLWREILLLLLVWQLVESVKLWQVVQNYEQQTKKRRSKSRSVSCVSSARARTAPPCGQPRPCSCINEGVRGRSIQLTNTVRMNVVTIMAGRVPKYPNSTGRVGATSAPMVSVWLKMSPYATITISGRGNICRVNADLTVLHKKEEAWCFASSFTS
jgi:hypothetical protein